MNYSLNYLLHLAQTFPAALASTQQGCAQSLPAAFALSQQDSAKTGAAKSENAREAIVRILVMFIAASWIQKARRFASRKLVICAEICFSRSSVLIYWC